MDDGNSARCLHHAGQSELCPTPRCRHQASRGTPRSAPVRAARHGMAHTPQGPWPVVVHGWHPIGPSHLTSVLISGRTDPSSRTPGKRASRPLALSWYCETRPCSSLLAKLGVHAAANFDVSAAFHGNCGPRSGARSTLRHAVSAVDRTCTCGYLHLMARRCQPPIFCRPSPAFSPWDRLESDPAKDPFASAANTQGDGGVRRHFREGQTVSHPLPPQKHLPCLTIAARDLAVPV